MSYIETFVSRKRHCPEVIGNIIKTSDIVKLHAYHKIALAMAASTPF